LTLSTRQSFNTRKSNLTHCIIGSSIDPEHDDSIYFIIQLFRGILRDTKIQTSGLVVVLALMSIQGVRNLNQQWQVNGEFNDVAMEEMVEWVKTNTPQSK
jgi:hypothetical protein